jgi:hypothetical protein
MFPPARAYGRRELKETEKRGSTYPDRWGVELPMGVKWMVRIAETEVGL